MYLNCWIEFVTEISLLFGNFEAKYMDKDPQPHPNSKIDSPVLIFALSKYFSRDVISA